MEEGNKEGNFYPQFYKKLYQWYEKHLWAARTVNVLYHLLPALAVLCYVDLLGLVYINSIHERVDVHTANNTIHHTNFAVFCHHGLDRHGALYPQPDPDHPRP